MKFNRLNVTGCKSLKEEEVSIVQAKTHPKLVDRFVWGGGRDDRGISRPKFEVIVCGTPLKPSSFPTLHPSKVKGGGQPMQWPSIS